MSKLEKTVELDKAEILQALKRSKEAAVKNEKPKTKNQTKELREAIKVIKAWAEDNNQWLVILAPWGMHHYGKLTEEQVELIMKRFRPE